MAVVYILRSKTTQQFYVGSTNDLARRMAEHLRAHRLATRGWGPWELVYKESFATLPEARRREMQIKAWKSAKEISALIEAAKD